MGKFTFVNGVSCQTRGIHLFHLFPKELQTEGGERTRALRAVLPPPPRGRRPEALFLGWRSVGKF